MAQDLEEVQALLQQTVSQVRELYDSRPISQPTCMLTHFSGEPGDINWSEWERKFSRIAILAGASQLDRKLALLSSYLKGASLSFYNELEVRQPRLVDWAAWSAEFLSRFPDNRQIDIKYEQLVNRSQKPGESVTEFSASIRYLAKRAFPTWNGADATDIIVKNHFITRLLPYIRRWVQNAEPTTFEKAVAEAQKQEIREQQSATATSSFVSFSNNLQVNPTDQLTERMRSSTLTDRFQPMNRNLSHHSPQSNFRGTNNRFRNFSSSIGPSNRPNSQTEGNWGRDSGSQRRDLGSNVNPGTNNNFQRFPSRTQDGVIICYHCRRPGHHQANCQQRWSQHNQVSSVIRNGRRSDPSRGGVSFRDVSRVRGAGSAQPSTRTINSPIFRGEEEFGSYDRDEQDSHQLSTNSTGSFANFDPLNCDDSDLESYYRDTEPNSSLNTRVVRISDFIDNVRQQAKQLPKIGGLTNGSHPPENKAGSESGENLVQEARSAIKMSGVQGS
jgi:hypothetical protein